MMDYEIFKAVVKEKFLSYMPEKYRDAAVDIRRSQKVNRTLDALTVHKEGDSIVFPTIYVNEMYEHYQMCNDLEAVLFHAAGHYAKVLDGVESYKPDIAIENLKDNVIMCLINTEQNREMLAGIPSREFQDLSVIYRWVIDQTQDAIGSVIVSDGLAKKAGLSEEELFQHAVDNTRRIAPAVVMSMGEAFGNIVAEMDVPEEVKEEFGREESPVDTMWIIGNSLGINGAVSMLYEENLHKLAEKVGDDLFILPTSIHELLAIPAGMAEGRLEDMVWTVQGANMDAVRLEDRLSNSVYHYDKNLRKVTLAAEGRQKRLDGKETELPLIQEENKAR